MDTAVNATRVIRPPPPPSEEESRLPEIHIAMDRLGQLLDRLLSMDSFLRRLPTQQAHKYLCMQIFNMINLVHSALGASSPIDAPEWQSPFTVASAPMTRTPRPALQETF